MKEEEEDADTDILLEEIEKELLDLESEEEELKIEEHNEIVPFNHLINTVEVEQE